MMQHDNKLRFMDLAKKDLARSNLTTKDLLISPYDSAYSEYQIGGIPPQVHVQGYIIPYFDWDGEQLPYKRVRIIRVVNKQSISPKILNNLPKYSQPKNSRPHLYIPKIFPKRYKNYKHFIEAMGGFYLVEGEKKAAYLSKHGIPALGLGGIYSWSTKSITVPKDATIQRQDDELVIKCNDKISELTISNFLLPEFNILEELDVCMIILFDHEYNRHKRMEVQRAAGQLADILFSGGISLQNVKYLNLLNAIPEELLPEIEHHVKVQQKIGVDDLPPETIIEPLQDILANPNNLCIPSIPNIGAKVRRQLEHSNSRQGIQRLCRLVIADMDSVGKRIRDVDSSTYFFHEENHELYKADFNAIKDINPSTKSVHGWSKFLYDRYGIDAGDSRFISRLYTSYTAIPGIQEAQVHKVLHVDPDGKFIAYQLSDNKYAKVTKEGIDILNNGEDGIIFAAKAVQPIDPQELYAALLQIDHEASKLGHIPNLWYDTLKTLNFRLSDSEDTFRKFISVLYYISPWLLKFKGTQLPIEIVIGEAGSGKSTLYSLRSIILTGAAQLRPVPTDIKDWYSSITSTGGLHITDNVVIQDTKLRQRLSDEMCRITTEPDPHVEMRRLYTTSDLMRLPVSTVFAITGIDIPFRNVDILQRSIILELNAIKSDISGEWLNEQLERNGGRTKWLASHLFAIHKFLKAIRMAWVRNYKSVHRLINFEQSMYIMSDILGMNFNVEDILKQHLQKFMISFDWVLQGIAEYCEAHKHPSEITIAQIVSWATTHPTYCENNILTSIGKLNQYIARHAATIERSFNYQIQKRGFNTNILRYQIHKNNKA